MKDEVVWFEEIRWSHQFGSNVLSLLRFKKISKRNKCHWPSYSHYCHSEATTDCISNNTKLTMDNSQWPTIVLFQNASTLDEVGGDDQPPIDMPPDLQQISKLSDMIINILMFIVGAPANFRVLYNLLSNKTYRKSRHHLLLLNLAVADSVVSFVTVPVEISWSYTNRWVAGNLTCKVSAI